MVHSIILRLPQVRVRTGLSRSSIYNGVKAGTFPDRVQLGPRAVGWDSAAIDAWVIERITASRGGRFSEGK